MWNILIRDPHWKTFLLVTLFFPPSTRVKWSASTWRLVRFVSLAPKAKGSLGTSIKKKKKKSWELGSASPIQFSSEFHVADAGMPLHSRDPTKKILKRDSFHPRPHHTLPGSSAIPSKSLSYKTVLTQAAVLLLTYCTTNTWQGVVICLLCRWEGTNFFTWVCTFFM